MDKQPKDLATRTPTIVDIVEFAREDAVPPGVPNPMSMADAEKYGKAVPHPVQDPAVIRALQQGWAAEEEADAAYRPAGEFYGPGKLIPDVHALRRVLKANPQIRRRPRRSKKTGRVVRNRPEVHAGDVFEYLVRTYPDADPVGLPDAVLDAALAKVAEVESGKKEAQALQEHGGHLA